MIRNLRFGLPTMAICLFLQSMLVVLALNYYARRQNLIVSSSPVVRFSY